MAITFKLDTEINRIDTRIDGKVAFSDLAKYFNEIFAHPRFTNDLRIFVDVSKVDGLSLESAGIRRFADFTEKVETHLAGIRIAVFAPQTLTFGLARMYQLFRVNAPYSISVFRDQEEAEVWLDSTQT